MSVAYAHDDINASTLSASVTVPAGALIIVSMDLFDGSGTGHAPALPTATGLTFVELGHIYDGNNGIGCWYAFAGGSGFTGTIQGDTTYGVQILTDHFTGAGGPKQVQTRVDAYSAPFSHSYGSALATTSYGYSVWMTTSGAWVQTPRTSWTKQVETTTASRPIAADTITGTAETAAGYQSYSSGGPSGPHYIMMEIPLAQVVNVNITRRRRHAG